MVGGGNLLFFQILLTVAFTVLGGLIRSTKELATDAPTGASISLRIWKPMDDTLPLDFRLLEIDQKTDGLAGGSQIVDTPVSYTHLIKEALLDDAWTVET